MLGRKVRRKQGRRDGGTEGRSEGGRLGGVGGGKGVFWGGGGGGGGGGGKGVRRFGMYAVRAWASERGRGRLRRPKQKAENKKQKRRGIPTGRGAAAGEKTARAGEGIDRPSVLGATRRGTRGLQRLESRSRPGGTGRVARVAFRPVHGPCPPRRACRPALRGPVDAPPRTPPCCPSPRQPVSNGLPAR